MAFRVVNKTTINTTTKPQSLTHHTAMRNLVSRSGRVRIGIGVFVLITAGLLWATGTPLSAILDDLYVFVPFIRLDDYRSIAFDGQRAYDHAWAQCNFGPRPPGSEALRQAGDYIIDQLEAQGWLVEEQTFDYQGVTVRNLIGRRGAGTPIIVGAHYDTRARANNDPDPNRRDDPVPGGNDGASGVGVLLELARSLNVHDTGHEVWLAFFDAEDNGSGGLPGWSWIVGSTYMAENLGSDVDFMILLDMIGDQDQRILWEGYSTDWMRETVWNVADELGYAEHFIPQVGPRLIDDHRPFLAQGIPALDIIDFDYPYWHTTADTCEKLDVDSLTRVGQVVEETLENRRLDIAR